jgi:CMP-N,N'-diacetyllegionaminic acid synthase
MIKKIAFIPARAGSKRIHDKNILEIGGHPLLAYSIRAAVDSGLFESVLCVTDSPVYAEIARYYGAETPFLRPPEISGERSPDIEWVRWIVEKLEEGAHYFDVFCILRPTSPFRTPDTIRRAWNTFEMYQPADSLRAVERCSQHPGKMWIKDGSKLLPLMPFKIGNTPWHSSQYAALPEVYVQNASLEIAWLKIIKEKGTISGDSIIAFPTDGFEGYDINDPIDVDLAKMLIDKGAVKLAELKIVSR